MRSLVPANAAARAVALAEDLSAAQDYAAASKASATVRAYRSDFEIFRAWCDARGCEHMPADPRTVCAFLASQAEDGSAMATLTRRVAAIRYAHKLAGHEPPTSAEIVKATLSGIKRTHGPNRPKRRKAPATAERIRAMIEGIADDTLAGLRDRALLLLGFAGAFRRSELVALTVEDLEETPEGFRVMIRKSKTDQDGEGQTIAIVRGGTACPVRAVRAWQSAAGIESGPLFRAIPKGGKRVLPEALSDCTVARIVKRYAEAAGLDPEAFAGHSLRAGFLTSAAGRGASIFKMMDVSRHKSVDTLRGYVRDAELFKDHAGAGLL